MNQGNLHEEVKSLFTTAQEHSFKNVGYGFQEDIDAGHGLIEVRRACILDFDEYKELNTSGLNGKTSRK